MTVKKPSETLLRMYRVMQPQKMETFYKMTSPDSAQDYVSFYYNDGYKEHKETFKLEELTCKGSYPIDYFEYRPNGRWVARLKDQFIKEIQEWEKFEKDNAKELEEYKRLKKKFEGS